MYYNTLFAPDLNTFSGKSCYVTDEQGQRVCKGILTMAQQFEDRWNSKICCDYLSVSYKQKQ